MEAKVKQESRYGTHIAFSGVEFVKYEWRPVPATATTEQREGQKDFLEFREAAPQEQPAGAKRHKPAGAKAETPAETEG